jgi:hypothetical protein
LQLILKEIVSTLLINIIFCMFIVMSDKKVGIFSTVFFCGIAALFFPATALENAIANAQEELVEGVADEEIYPLSYEEGEESSSNG